MAMLQGPGSYQELKSEQVVVSAPMSFAGSTQRLFRWTRTWGGDDPEWWADVLRAVFLIVVLPIVWSAILFWYMFFGIWLVPYRLLRRSSRQTKKRQLQHREMLAQMQAQAISVQTAVASQVAAQPVNIQPQLTQAHAVAENRAVTAGIGAPSSPAPPPSHPAAWHTDPTGRCAQRWWDGTSWTDHVATVDGTRSEDAFRSQPVEPSQSQASTPTKSVTIETGQPAPAWYPDPTGRYPIRWWDGSWWTEHVANADGSIRGVDAAPARPGP